MLTDLTNEVNEELKVEIREAFELFDTDKDNALDFHELKVTMRALGFDEKKPEILKIIRQHDKTGEGLISYDDFYKMRLKEHVKSFDDDGTGKISLENLKRVAKELGENIDEDELQSMIDEFDFDEDGEKLKDDGTAVAHGEGLKEGLKKAQDEFNAKEQKNSLLVGLETNLD
ncbi:2890_t:CDS:2 [Entrophospora sp. SA101]|nr:2890_t:CDS:2 [Entrophospora sp. SA101]CAJ0823247.1 10807_t:CDS:2 [Entrophospora sp. SA101]